MTPERSSWQSCDRSRAPRSWCLRVMQLVTILLALTVAIKRSR